MSHRPAFAILTIAVVIAIASHFLLSSVDDSVLRKSRSQKPNNARKSDQLTKSGVKSESNDIYSLADTKLDLINKLISSLWPKYVK